MPPTLQNVESRESPTTRQNVWTQDASTYLAEYVRAGVICPSTWQNVWEQGATTFLLEVDESTYLAECVRAGCVHLPSRTCESQWCPPTWQKVESSTVCVPLSSRMCLPTWQNVWEPCVYTYLAKRVRAVCVYTYLADCVSVMCVHLPGRTCVSRACLWGWRRAAGRSDTWDPHPAPHHSRRGVAHGGSGVVHSSCKEAILEFIAQWRHFNASLPADTGPGAGLPGAGSTRLHHGRWTGTETRGNSTKRCLSKKGATKRITIRCILQYCA